MHNHFDAAAKEILNLSDRAIIPFLNSNFAASIPPNVPVLRTNTEHRIPSFSQKSSHPKTIIADAVFLVADTCYHIEVQLDRRTGMALRMFLYDLAKALEDPGEEDGAPSSTSPKAWSSTWNRPPLLRTTNCSASVSRTAPGTSTGHW